MRFILMVLLAALVCSCQTAALRPNIQAYSSDVEFEPDKGGGKDQDLETDFLTAGLEYAVPMENGDVWYVDADYAKAETDDVEGDDLIGNMYLGTEQLFGFLIALGIRF